MLFVHNSIIRYLIGLDLKQPLSLRTMSQPMLVSEHNGLYSVTKNDSSVLVDRLSWISHLPLDLLSFSSIIRHHRQAKVLCEVFLCLQNHLRSTHMYRHQHIEHQIILFNHINVMICFSLV